MRKTSKLALVVAIVAALSQAGCAQMNGSQGTTATSALATIAQQLITNQDSQTTNALSSLINNPLVTSLTNSLTGVSDTQAATGTAALLALAMNSISPQEKSELEEVVPQAGLFSNLIPASLSSQLTNFADVKSVLAGLGLNASTSDKLAPTLIDSISNKTSASPELISTLVSLWQ